MRHVLRLIGLIILLVSGWLVVPPPLLAATGTGPGGYTWKDCLEPGGPSCAYTLIAQSDDATGLCSDEIYNDSGDALGFSFPFYGVNYTDYAVSSNGLVYLANAPTSGSDVVNASLTGLEGRPMLAVLWDDWAMDNWDESFGFCPRDPECSNSGWEPFLLESLQRGVGNDAGVPYKEFGWFSTAHHDPCTESAGQQATFGLRLHADGRILFLYEDTDLGLPASLDDGLSATIGISSGFNGEYTLVSFNVASIPTNPYTILFEPPGCPALACDAISVTPNPACQGMPQTFSVTTSGGVAPLVVDWDFNGDTVRDAQGSPVVRTLGPGSYSVTATVSDSCSQPGSQSCQLFTSMSVFANPSPTITPASTTSFCASLGESVTLNATPGFVSYQWQRDDTDISGERSESLVATTSGSYTVIVTDADGCVGESRVVIVNATDCPDPCPPLDCLSLTIQPNPACDGDIQSLRATWAGGEGLVSVSWDLDGDTLTDATGQQILRAFSPGLSTVTVTIQDSCPLPLFPQSCQMQGDARVNPVPRPIITPGGPTLFCAMSGGSVTLDADPSFATYSWFRGGSPLPGETAPSLLVTQTGSYVVAVADADGCVGTSPAVLVNADDCGLPCPVLACGVITITSDPSCEGDTQELLLDVSGGQGVVSVSWDLDGDTVSDVTGNPVQVQLPVGVVPIRAIAVDQCATPTPQQCASSQDATVRVGSGALIEVSRPGDRQLLVSADGSSLTIAQDPEAVAYNVLSDAIGTYAPSPATGSTCSVSAWTDNGDGTLTLPVPVATNHWVIVTSSNHCGEGPPGANSRGTDRLTYVGWVPCGAAP